MNDDWVRVFEHEMARRRRLRGDNPERYKKIWMTNPKGLLFLDKCTGHVWVPATHLMIHDGTGGNRATYTLNDVPTRGFSEAAAYRQHDYQIVPQVCWNCDATRVLCSELLSAAEQLRRLTAARPKKQRGRKIQQEVMSIDLFE